MILQMIKVEPLMLFVKMHRIRKGCVLEMDLVEISPAYENANMTLAHAERLICNFIGATVRAGYYD